MATIINTPGTSGNNDSSAGLVVGIIVAIVVVALILLYAIPGLRKNSGNTTNSPSINIQPPSGSSGGSSGGTGGTNY